MKLRTFERPGALPGFLFFLACMALGIWISGRSGNALRYQEICNLVYRQIYLPEKDMAPWLSKCLQRSNLVTKDTSVDTIIQDLNEQFDLLHTSHLWLYNAAEAKKTWEGKGLETGLASQYVEGHLVIFRVLPGSPAENAGLRKGDVIFKINEFEATPDMAQNTSGSYLIVRNKEIKEYKIKTAEIQTDDAPLLIPVSAKTAIFKISSFREEYFEKQKLNEQIRNMKAYQKIIVDLRGNLGGNFVAGLRFLSAFMCSPQDIGYLWKPKSTLKREEVMPDDLDNQRQISILDTSFLVKLWTFDGYDCVTSSVAVLVDSGTASTAELVAQALKDYVGAKIFGSSTAGSLLAGMWYGVPALAKGVKISIPEAVYQTRRGHKIEGPGVQIDKTLYYHIEELQNGEDSWVKSAVQLF